MTDVMVRAGVERLFTSYAKLQHNDFVVIAFTPDARISAAHLVLYLKARQVSHTTMPMWPLVDSHIDQRLAGVLPDAGSFAGNLIVVTLERESMSHVFEFANLFELYGAARTRILRMISTGDEMFEYGLALDPEEIESLNATLLRRLDGCSVIAAASPSGSRLEIRLDQGKYEWISNRGRLRSGGFMILPPGEIATYPGSVSGVLVADGAVNCNFLCDLDMRLKDYPVTLELEESEVVDFRCERADIRDLIARAFTLDHAHVGELGFGTNRAIEHFIPLNSHLNERHPGIHLGLGQHNQMKTLVSYDVPVHVDFVTDGASLSLGNGETINLATFEADGSIRHPALMRDEDVTGDCCSAGCSVVRVPASLG